MRWPSITPAGIRTLSVLVVGRTPAPEQSGHGSSIQPPGTPAVVTGLGEPERTLVVGHQAGAVTGRADARRTAHLRPGPSAGVTAALGGQPNRHGRAVHRFGEPDPGLHLDIGAPPGLAGWPDPTTTAPTTTEQPTEQVTETTAGTGAR
jgi:hypothetical protein